QKAKISNTWVEESARILRGNVRRNELARYWYRVFLSSQDRDIAWGALQIVITTADERLLNWWDEVGDECPDIQLREERLRFLSLISRDTRELRKRLDRDN